MIISSLYNLYLEPSAIPCSMHYVTNHDRYTLLNFSLNQTMINHSIASLKAAFSLLSSREKSVGNFLLQQN